MTGENKNNQIGLLQYKREQKSIFAKIHKAIIDEIISLLLEDQIYEVVKYEKMANEAKKVAEKNINLKKRNK